jgi:hypothetical protein
MDVSGGGGASVGGPALKEDLLKDLLKDPREELL